MDAAMQTAQQLDDRAWNWARWAASDTHRRGRCGSAESRFIPPRVDDEKLQRQVAACVDVIDAQVFEQAVCRMRCVHDRSFLVWWYVERRDEREIARKLRLNIQLLPAFRLRVLGAVAMRLDEICSGGESPVVARRRFA